MIFTMKQEEQNEIDPELLESRVRLGKFIRERREALGLNRREFEFRSGVPSTTLPGIELGSGSVSMYVLRLIARGLELPAATLMAVYAGETDSLKDYLVKTLPIPDILQTEDIEILQKVMNRLVAARIYENNEYNEKVAELDKQARKQKYEAAREMRKIEKAGS